MKRVFIISILLSAILTGGCTNRFEATSPSAQLMNESNSTIITLEYDGINPTDPIYVTKKIKEQYPNTSGIWYNSDNSLYIVQLGGGSSWR
jgi:hypothetical protein